MSTHTASKSDSKTDARHAVAGQTRKYMTFTLASERYAMPIDLLDEVIALLPATPVPNTPSFVVGLLNLRGRIIPVVDLRLKLRMDTPALRRRACILIVRVPVREGMFHIGVIAEAVHEIVAIAPEQIAAPPNFGVKLSTRFLEGIVKLDDTQALLLIDAVKALTVKELADLQTTADSGAAAVPAAKV